MSKHDLLQDTEEAQILIKAERDEERSCMPIFVLQPPPGSNFTSVRAVEGLGKNEWKRFFPQPVVPLRPIPPPPPVRPVRPLPPPRWAEEGDGYTPSSQFSQSLQEGQPSLPPLSTGTANEPLSPPHRMDCDTPQADPQVDTQPVEFTGTSPSSPRSSESQVQPASPRRSHPGVSNGGMASDTGSGSSSPSGHTD